jgi:hypothetical protein
MWKIVGIFLSAVVLIAGMVAVPVADEPTDPYPFLSWHLGCPQESISPIEMETETVPLDYFRLTVSPAEVCAHVGEQVEIRCVIDCMINTPVEISSVSMVLFDSHYRMIREQAMIKDSYWCASTVYTIVGDETYFRMEFNFNFISLSESGEYSESGEHTEYGAYCFPISIKAGPTPIEVVSVVEPISPFNPAGPVVEVTVKNAAAEPVVSLTATLKTPSGLNTLFDITFNVTPGNPLQTGASISAVRTLIGGGISSGDSYPLTISATLQGGAQFVYTKLVQIAGP